MFYTLFRFFVRAALAIFCRRITVDPKQAVTWRGPALLAANHPNSFLDALIIGSRFQQPVHFLARGDAFRKPSIRKLLFQLNMIPIYRLSEGREHLALNDATFAQCQNIFAAGGMVLVFSEGLCVHQSALRPLKKGTARIALAAFASPALAPFRVIPVSIRYDSFDRFGKQVAIVFGSAIEKSLLPSLSSEAEQIKTFNEALSEKLTAGLRVREQVASIRGGWLLGMILVISFPIVAAGWLLQAPLYIPLRRIAHVKTKGTVFFDSVLFGLLLLSYPFYWLVMNSLGLGLQVGPFAQVVLFLLPGWAWIFVQWKALFVSVFYSRRAG